MKRSRLILILLLIIVVGYFLGGYLLTIGWFLFKLMLGILGIALLAVGYYLAKLTKR